MLFQIRSLATAISDHISCLEQICHNTYKHGHLKPIETKALCTCVSTHKRIPVYPTSQRIHDLYYPLILSFRVENKYPHFLYCYVVQVFNFMCQEMAQKHSHQYFQTSKQFRTETIGISERELSFVKQNVLRRLRYLIQSIPYHPIPLRCILKLSTHLRLGFPSCLFPSGFPTNILYAFLFSKFVLHALPISAF
jgi:hypothetical protein